MKNLAGIQALPAVITGAKNHEINSRLWHGADRNSTAPGVAVILLLQGGRPS
jgi:hypothetical protein